MWLQSSDHQWYEPLKVLAAGDAVEVIVTVRKNFRHCIVRASGESWTVPDDGTFLDCTFHEVVEGAGAAQLAQLLTGVGGRGLVHFCDSARDLCEVASLQTMRTKMPTSSVSCCLVLGL